MIRAEMHTSLGNRMNDPSEDRYDSNKKDRAINDAQQEVFEVLPTSELSELEKYKLAILSTDTGVTRNTNYTQLAKDNDTLFTVNALRFVSGGFVKTDNTEKHWFTLLKKSELWKTNNNFLFGYSVNSPIIIDTGTYFHIYPAQPVGFNIDIDGYLRAPPDVSDSQNSLFKPTLHFLIVTLAELILKNKHDQLGATINKYTQDLGISVKANQ